MAGEMQHRKPDKDEGEARWKEGNLLEIAHGVYFMAEW